MNASPPATDSAWRKLCRRFGWAWRGVCVLFRTQANARIQAFAAIVATIAGFVCGISRGEWCAIVLAIALVLTAEAVNTAIEATVDLASPGLHSLAERAKDVAAGAVLLAAIASVIIAALVFLPHVLPLFGFK